MMVTGSSESGDIKASASHDPISVSSVIDAPVFTLANERLEELVSNRTALEGIVSPSADTAAVVLAGGSGIRFGNPGGKQLFDLLGRPVVTWAVEAFDAVPEVGSIIVVCPENSIDEFRRIAFDPYPFVTPIEFVSSGDIRQESAFNGVNAVDDSYEFIAMHDGARPLVTPQLIRHAIAMLKGTLDADGAIVGHPAVDTLKVVGDGIVVGTPDRSMFWNAQTPQVFRAEILRRAHVEALSQGFVGTDDSALVERLGAKVLLVDGPRDNIKVTVPEDAGPVVAAMKARLGAMRRV